MTDYPLDFGHGVRGTFTRWEPDRDLNPQYADVPDVKRFGLILDHPDARDPSRRCTAGLTFDGPVQARISPGTPRWVVEQWEPLTLSPSILCVRGLAGCGLHGFIRDGLWVPA